MSSQSNYQDVSDVDEKHNWEDLLESENSNNPELEDEQSKDQEDSPEPEHDREEKTTKSSKPPARSQSSTKKPRRRKNSPEPDYSAGIQEQVAGSNRTLNACDRCRVCI